jgi:Family of unknown function (DUF6236)
MSSHRGLVVSCPILASKRGFHITGGGKLDLQELRFSLLFWDKLDFPTNNIIGFGSDQEADFLASAGILQRTPVEMPLVGDPADLYRAAHVTAYKALEQHEPGVWSLATGERSISFADDDLDGGRGALVRLHHAIPVPDKDVPLQDVLEFRTRRRDELLALRHHLEQVYQRVLDAGDGPLAWNTEVAALERAITDHTGAANSSGLAFRWSGFDANLNLWPGITAAMTAYGQGASALTALAVGGAALAPTLAVNVGAALKGRNAQATPFRYVSRYYDELFLGP